MNLGITNQIFTINMEIRQILEIKKTPVIYNSGKYWNIKVRCILYLVLSDEKRIYF